MANDQPTNPNQPTRRERCDPVCVIFARAPSVVGPMRVSIETVPGNEEHRPEVLRLALHAIMEAVVERLHDVPGWPEAE